jgi:hypothetical protein
LWLSDLPALWVNFMVEHDEHRLSSPQIFVVRMSVFLILVGFVVLILYRQIFIAFMANPGLNCLIIGVLLIGIFMAVRQVVRLFREIAYVNGLRDPHHPARHAPVLLAPMVRLIGSDAAGYSVSAVTLRVMLDGIATRLDESRELARYLTGLLVFLGLLGTFWGLLETVGSIGGVLKSMQAGADATVMFDDLKNGLAAPIAGMSISFTSSLFGLSGSLILGFLDLQAGQAQNRFFTELEDRLSSRVIDAPLEASGLAEDVPASLHSLAKGVHHLALNMRQEQDLIRSWVQEQAQQQQDVKKVLDRLAQALDGARES